MAWRYIVPALAVTAQLTAAQCSGKTTISTQAQATGLASCSTYNGDIWIAKGTTDDISLDGIQNLKGSLLAQKVSKMTSLSAENLATIGDTFGLSDVTQLTNLNFPSLTQVGTIFWEGLPTLSSLAFGQTVQKANDLSIQNTGLSSLEGIDLQKIEALYIANNPFLADITMQVSSISGALNLAANGRDIKVDFPNLETAYNMSFRNVSQLSMPSLASVKSSLGFYSNFFQSLQAPNLTQVGGSLSFVSNGMLADISLPELKQIGGGLQVANNTKLEKVNGFNRLATVNGDINMFGDFTTVTLPKLTLVKGAFNLQSSKDLGNTCSHFSSIAGPNDDIRGQFTCKDQQKTVPGESSSDSNSNSNGAQSVLIPYATGIIGIVAAIFGML